MPVPTLRDAPPWRDPHRVAGPNGRILIWTQTLQWPPYAYSRLEAQTQSLDLGRVLDVIDPAASPGVWTTAHGCNEIQPRHNIQRQTPIPEPVHDIRQHDRKTACSAYRSWVSLLTRASRTRLKGIWGHAAPAAHATAADAELTKLPVSSRVVGQVKFTPLQPRKQSVHAAAAMPNARATRCQQVNADVDTEQRSTARVRPIRTYTPSR
jgi:hypothetical protein